MVESVLHGRLIRRAAGGGCGWLGKYYVLASLDILLVLATLVWALAGIRDRARWVALVNIPYLLWVAFATVLQLSITWLNRSA